MKTIIYTESKEKISGLPDYLKRQIQQLSEEPIVYQDEEGREKALDNKKISECNEAVLIHQSVTGMYERKIDLLKI